MQRKFFLFFHFTLATANICNVVLMRNHELFTGIEVKDGNGNVVGTSKIAAQKVSTKLTARRGVVFSTRDTK